jgi:hypothetical protein
VAALAVVLVAGVSIALALARNALVPSSDNKATGSTVVQQAKDRGAAASWVASQVSRRIVVSCDRLMCNALEQDGFPSSQVRRIEPTSATPLSSQLIVVTPTIRRQFGASINHNLAPAVLAAFGSASDRITVQVIAPHGVAAYRAAASADQKLRKTVGEGLITSRQITASPAARKAMMTGRVDARVLIILTALAAQDPIDIVSFGPADPGAAPGAPLRTVELAETNPAVKLDRPAYVKSMTDLLHAQPSRYRPVSVTTVSVAGVPALRVEFAAPSPLGLLSPTQ